MRPERLAVQDRRTNQPRVVLCRTVSPTSTVRHAELLSFKGCPHAAPAADLAQRVLREFGIDAEVCVLNVAEEATQVMRFSGSPSIRVNGVDVEPSADSRRSFAHGCRFFATPTGLRALLLEGWIREALQH